MNVVEHTLDTPRNKLPCGCICVVPIEGAQAAAIRLGTMLAAALHVFSLDSLTSEQCTQEPVFSVNIGLIGFYI